ncbi:protein kinase [Nonomuraea sp. MCN248]|uniref:non-specific serine/threonine protein kinase n=1 Tax=Nonomuraea corallina TaxID=2989783 RepID=A0ABT4S8L0_9ACTN|nr:serine/threonine protein kinase [Nonomuraea corallina]MDA0633567.1 protein kinase [Nonomuraea corallina]
MREPPLLSGRYRLRSELGRGGMGTVWEAYDELLDREVAVKELTVPYAPPEHREVLIQRAMREARIAARLHHPNIATVHDVVLADGRPWIVMQLVRSHSLSGEIYDRGALAAPVVAGIGLDVLAALRAAHAAGVLHRDVKPANILLTADGHAVLTDFGLAIALDDAHDDGAALTQLGVVMGTPAYVAPERAAGGRATELSDVWSLGATLYTAVEGRAPFPQGGSRLDTLHAVLTRDPAPFERAGGLAPALAAMLTKDPAQRPGLDRVRELLHQARTGSSRHPGPIPAREPLHQAQARPRHQPGPVSPGPGPSPQPLSTRRRNAGRSRPDLRPAPPLTADQTAGTPQPASTPSREAGRMMGRPWPVSARCVAAVTGAVLIATVVTAVSLQSSPSRWHAGPMPQPTTDALAEAPRAEPSSRPSGGAAREERARTERRVKTHSSARPTGSARPTASARPTLSSRPTTSARPTGSPDPTGASRPSVSASPSASPRRSADGIGQSSDSTRWSADGDGRGRTGHLGKSEPRGQAKGKDK